MLNELELLDGGALSVVIVDCPFAHQATIAPDDVFTLAQGFPVDAAAPEIPPKTTTGLHSFEDLFRSPGCVFAVYWRVP